MRIEEVHRAAEALLELGRIEQLLKINNQEATVVVPCQPRDVQVTVGPDVWREVLGKRRQQLSDELRALGVEW